MLYRDGHHIIHHRLEWTLRPEARKIRNTPSLIVTMGREAVHDVIHDNCPPIPLLGFHTLLRVNKEFYPTRDTLGTMDNLMKAIEIAGNSPKAHPVEKSLAELAIWAIDLQRPYIAEHLANENTTFIDMGAL